MSEQRLLFELRTQPWVDRLWRSITPEARREIVSLLAEMGHVSLTGRRAVPGKKEHDDESR